jgi:hypothetical protein
MLGQWRGEIWTCVTRVVCGTERDQVITLVARCMFSFNKKDVGFPTPSMDPHGPIISFAGSTGMREKVGR